MRRVKKKDLGRNHFDKSQNSEPQGETIDELVDGDGSPIEGDRNPLSNSEIEVDKGQTTDDFVQGARQPNMMYGLHGMGAAGYSNGSRFIAAETAKAKEILTRILKESKNK